MDSLICRAAKFAFKAHKMQRRKYSGQPYYNHVSRVAGRVAALPNATETMVAAAFLHDVIEDTEFTEEDLRILFAGDVIDLVVELTNTCTREAHPNLSKLDRKRKENSRLAECSLEAKLIKLCDRIDNISDDNHNAPVKWVMRYILESEDMADKFDDISTAKLVSELRNRIDKVRTLFNGALHQ